MSHHVARVNIPQIERFAGWMKEVSSIKPFDFCNPGAGVVFPENNQAGALEALFFNAAHQFGFWHLENNRYARPMVACVGGKDRKGSDFVFYCTQRALNGDASFFDPAKLALMTDHDCDAFFHDDHGVNPMPMWPDHLAIMKKYAEWFVRNGFRPADLVERANAAIYPLQTFLKILRDVPGYMEDPLQKKAMLLAIMMENRPEHFLHVSDPQSAVPIIDYHLQRSALRTGLVEILDDNLRAKLERRECMEKSEEKAIRDMVYEAIQSLVDLSGLSVAAVDYFFFMNRTRCPEMSEPVCAECPVQSICRRHTKLFQPVFRTTFY
ncbi:MAG TPA: hypothetical protein PJ991_02185 [Kiritimatiellia bacterium]|nr:hypothetical protein [Kiritimatiellia bacterium]